MREFKVGDKVRVVQEQSYCNFTIGKEYEVYNVRGDKGYPITLLDDDDDMVIIKAETIELVQSFKRGDKVLVRDCDRANWNERIYLTTIEGARFPTVCIADSDEIDQDGGFETTGWTKVKPLPETKVVTHSEAIAVLKENYGSDVVIEIKED